METNDKMLKDFFSANKTEIADNGFSKRVMRQLPEPADKSWIVWLFASLGLVLTILLGVQNGVLEQILLHLKNISIYYWLGCICLFPIVGSMSYCYVQGKTCVLRF